MSHARYRLLVLSVLVQSFALVPLAHATHPDPVWVRGSCDGGDLAEALLGAPLPPAHARRKIALRVEAVSLAAESPPIIERPRSEALPFGQRRVSRGLNLDANVIRPPPSPSRDVDRAQEERRRDG